MNSTSKVTKHVFRLIPRWIIFCLLTNNNGLNISITNDLNYTKKYDSTDRELMIDLSHTYVKNDANDYLSSRAYDPVGIELRPRA
jgi:hypothetical protein